MQDRKPPILSLCKFWKKCRRKSYEQLAARYVSGTDPYKRKHFPAQIPALYLQFDESHSSYQILVSLSTSWKATVTIMSQLHLSYNASLPSLPGRQKELLCPNWLPQGKPGELWQSKGKSPGLTCFRLVSDNVTLQFLSQMHSASWYSFSLKGHRTEKKDLNENPTHSCKTNAALSNIPSWFSSPSSSSLYSNQ